MKILGEADPWAAEQVIFHEQFRSHFAGMLALLPGIRNFLGQKAPVRARTPGTQPAARPQAPAKMPSLRDLLGQAQTNEPLYDQHVLGTILHNRPEIFGKDFNLLDNVRFQIGFDFAVEISEMDASKIKVTYALQAEHVAMVVTLPYNLAGLLKAAPSQGWRYRQMGRQATRGVNYVLDAYRKETLRLAAEEKAAAEKDEEIAAWESEQGGKVEILSVDALKQKGEPLKQFLKPVGGGRNIGVPGAQVGLLLESFRMAVHPEGQTLWQAIEPQVEFLRQDGQVRSSALLVQALMITDTHAIKDSSLGKIIDELKQNITDARAQQGFDHLSLEVQYVAELINRSRLGNLPGPAELFKPLEKPAAEAPGDKLVFLAPSSHTGLINGLIQDAHAKQLSAGNLEALKQILFWEPLRPGKTPNCSNCWKEPHCRKRACRPPWWVKMFRNTWAVLLPGGWTPGKSNTERPSFQWPCRSSAICLPIAKRRYSNWRSPNAVFRSPGIRGSCLRSCR